MSVTRRQLLLVSNGYGEDIIGAKIGAGLRQVAPTLEIRPFPLIGPGSAYHALGMTPIAESPVPNTGGFIRTPADAISDISGGLLQTLWQQRRVIQTASLSATAIAAIGDVFCLLWATAGARHPTLFLPTAKSDRFMPHSAIEYAIIRRRANWIFPRDSETTASFRSRGLDAYYFGNPMMDGLLDSSPLQRPQDRLTLALLPGSRVECYANFDRILAVIQQMSTPLSIYAWVCLSPNVDSAQIKTSLTRNGFRESNGQWHTQNDTISLELTTQFSAAVQAADTVIGLAGTANEQAIWLGKPVIAFPGTGPQSHPRRFHEQRRLLGPRFHFVQSNSPKDIATVVTDSLLMPPIAAPLEPNAALAIARFVAPLIT